MNQLPSSVVPPLRRCGDTGWLVELADNAAVHTWAATLRSLRLPGVTEVVPGLTTLLITFDPLVTTSATVRRELADLRPIASDEVDGERHVIGVHYDGQDLDAVARHTGLAVAEVVAAHVGTPWRVAFCGFAPGFSYLVGGDPRLQVPRRDEARVRVPAGAVAIAGQFSSIYPRSSPGGWQLLGHTEETVWDASAAAPALLQPGSLVEFRDLGAT